MPDSVPETPEFKRGDANRRAVLGDAYVEQSYLNTNPLAVKWRNLSTELSWGQIWERPGLDLKTRSFCTVAALVALGDNRELKIHMRGALRLGITPDELLEMFIQVGSYAGMPRVGSALGILLDILEEDKDK